MATNVKAKSPTHGINLAQVLGKRGFASEIAKIRKADQERRDTDAKRILGTDVIRDKDVDAAKLLMTTLGGRPRPITMADLRQFEHSARQLGDRFKGGITARGVVDASLQVDRDRANEQIRTAVIHRAAAGKLHFVTNAGPDSDVTRHHVHVEFPGFSSYAASPIDPKRVARSMLNSALKFECDCGRFTFWYRFIATKGRFVAGRLETGFPRIRNPRLVGVACKHALRVMQAVLTDANVLAQTAKMIAAAQAGQVKAPQTMTAAEAKAVAARQLEQSHHLRNRVETAGERATRIAKTPAAKARALQAAVKLAQQREATAKKKAQQTIKKSMATIRAELAKMGLSKAQQDAMAAQIMAAQEKG